MKKIFALALALMLALSLATCGGKSDNAPPNNNGGGNFTVAPSSQDSRAATPQDASPLTETSGKETLVGNVGDTIEHGAYLGKTKEWQCLAVDTFDTDNSRALLVSTEIVFYWVFNADDGSLNTSSQVFQLQGVRPAIWIDIS